MNELKTKTLSDPGKSAAFYKGRYARGYMKYRPPETRKRIRDVSAELDLPEIGEALDLSCGQGELTDVLRESQPGWKVYGCNIRALAIKNAGVTYPGCEFFLSGDDKFKER